MGDANRRAHRPHPWMPIVASAVLVLGATACGGGDDDDSGEESGVPEGVDVEELLGPAEPASGEPVRLGMVSDGATDAFDNTDELRAAEAAAEYWNEHRGGVAGRPIEVVPCETGADPGGATDCANQLVEEGVVAVALHQSGVADSVWEPLHAAGIPTMMFQAFGEGLLADEASTFAIVSPLSTFFGLPISVAESEGADEVAFVIIDVPQALDILQKGQGPEILENAGVDYEIVRVPPGTADMTPQMQQVVESGAGVVHVIGNDAFCIAAFSGLTAAGYDGAVTSISQCVTEATRDAVPAGALDGMYLTASVALGAEDDPTYLLYEAVVRTYGDDVSDTETTSSMGGYASMAALATSLEGLTGDVTSQSVVDAIRAMPAEELPGGGGVTFRCDGSALASQPAVCSNEWLRTRLDAEGHPTTYEPVDSTDLLAT